MRAKLRAGSTLIELLVVLGLLAFLAAVVTPVVDLPGSWDRSNHISEIERIQQAAIREARAVHAVHVSGNQASLFRAEPSGLILVDSGGRTRAHVSRGRP
jgi:Tfp pilus assembly protein FimT